MAGLIQNNAIISSIPSELLYEAIDPKENTALIKEAFIYNAPNLTQNYVLEIEERGGEAAQDRAEKMAQVVAGQLSPLPSDELTAIIAASKAHLHQVSQTVLGQASITISGEPPRSDDNQSSRISQANRMASEAQKGLVCDLVQQMLTLPISALNATPSAAAKISSENAAPEAPIVPQIYKRKDGGFNLLRAVPPIENLILPGGGAKGIGLAGALVEMENAGMLSSLQAVAGSSAGALMATWLSVGRSLPELGLLLSGKFRDLLESNKALNHLYPDIQFKSTAVATAKLLQPFGASHDTATGMIKKLDEVTAEGVRDYLINQNPADLQRNVKSMIARDIKEKVAKGEMANDPSVINVEYEQRSKNILDRFAVLQAPLDFTGSRQGKMVTFADMAALHAIAPEKFRSLRITAHDLAKHDHIIFDDSNTPTLPVAYAARASMAHPLIATGVSFPGYTWEGASHVFSDGGISSNVPIEALVPLADPEKTDNSMPIPAYRRLRASTVVFAFDEDGEAARTMQRSPELEWNERGWFSRLKDYVSYGVMGWVASNPDMAQDSLDDRQKIHDFGPNTLVVKHGDISSLDLDAGCKSKSEAVKLARTSLQQQLKIVRGDSYAVEVDSIEEALDLLDPAEKAILIASQSVETEDNIIASVEMPDKVLSEPTPQEQLLTLAMNEHSIKTMGRIMFSL